MKYCSKCGAEMRDEDVFCSNCGYSSSDTAPEKKTSGSSSDLKIVIKIMMIIGTVFMGIYVFPLAWCIPMTVIAFKKMDNNEPMSLGFKICTLIFVSMIAGILMLVDGDNC